MTNHYQPQNPANILTALFQPEITQSITIMDNSLRDGEQAPGVAYSLEDKLEIAQIIAKMGIHCITFGFPAVSEQERSCIREIAALKLPFKRTVVGARLVQSDIDYALACNTSWIGVFISISDWHLHDKLKITETEALNRMAEHIPYALQGNVKVLFVFEDATRTPLPRLLRFVQQAVDLGVHAISLADTVGILVPSATYRLYSLLRKLVPCELACHFHNDLGMATANALAALEAGADLIDGTIMGLGERAGNIPLEELVVALQVKYGRDLGIRLDLLPKAAEIIARAAQVQWQVHKPILGSQIFQHESGIHVHGLLANPLCYQAYPPELVGQQHQIVYGKHSGMAGIVHLLQQEQIELPRAQQLELLEKIKAAAVQKQAVSTKMVIEWARAMLQKVDR